MALALALALLPVGIASSQTDRQAVVLLVRGTAEQSQAGEAGWRPLASGTALGPGDRVRTASAGAVELRLADGSLVRLGERSEIELVRESVEFPRYPVASSLRVGFGTVRVFVDADPTDRAPTGSIGVGLTTAISVAVMHRADVLMTFNLRVTLHTLGGVAMLAPVGWPGEPVDVARNRVSVIEAGQGPTTPRPISPAARASLLAALPFESVPVPAPGAPTAVERTEALLRALAQITSTDRTASVWLLRGPELRLQTPGSVTLGRPNPATSPASTTVRVRFD